MRWLLKLISSGVLDRALDTVDRRIDAETDRKALQAEIVREHMKRRASWMQAGGFWTLLIAGAPFVYHAAAVNLYSVHWCADCHAPKGWSIAALPAPFDQYQGWVILAFIGALSLLAGWRR